MNGWTGKVLRVDLTNGVVSKEDLNMDWARDYVGMRGLGAKYLYEEMVDPTVDALHPDNVLVFSTGPLTGTGASASSRYSVVTKSPLTGGMAGSNRGLLGPRAQIRRVRYGYCGGSGPKPSLPLDLRRRCETSVGGAHLG